ncbi:MAG: hypothetical protein P4L69_24015 [Desulfosporosinus sp.]|nr:hypothetical protein [Desulfosporosinus sp.]
MNIEHSNRLHFKVLTKSIDHPLNYHLAFGAINSLKGIMIDGFRNLLLAKLRMEVN